MKLKQIFFTVAISAVTALAVIWGYGTYVKNSNTYAGQQEGIMPANYKYAGLLDGGTPPGATIDFTAPAQAATPAVVHIKTKTNAKQVSNNLSKKQPNNPFSDLFDDDMFNHLFGNRGRGVIPEQRASGSGVIISDDGYIVTNNHVVENADEINVTLSNKKTYKAKVIGTDPSYDLAVIKVEAAGLPFLLYGNSDDLKVGQWVLAIGYPLNLETTVTAGIISAKARSLGLNKDKNGDPASGVESFIQTGNPGGAVESFIQTDAAVNMGNSGGALINTDGRLIGVNSAIASPTGYYSGYSYAIPVNIVKKVVDDLIKFGTVQRGFLGVRFVNASDITEDDKKRQGIPATAEGIYVTDVPTDGGAYEAGIRKGDILTKVNGADISNGAEMQGLISRQKPGDAVIETLGAELTTLDAKKAREYGVTGGVIVKKINEGAINDQTRMKDGFIILKVNDKEVKTVDEMKAAVGVNKSITISGFYPGYDGVYEYPLSLDDN